MTRSSRDRADPFDIDQPGKRVRIGPTFAPGGGLILKGVFDTKPSSGYDDSLAERYHFPATRPYLDVARAVVDDWILYREPRRNDGRQAYIGAARVDAIEADPQSSRHAYARISHYQEFDPVVPFAGAPQGRYWEERLRQLHPTQAGRSLQGRSLRLIGELDFASIAHAGLSETFVPENAVRYGLGMSELPSLPLSGYPEPNDEDYVRRVEQTLVNRTIRDSAFRRLVCQAYDDTCAVTGLRIINGGGRSEVQAAHIWPVESGGPDVIQNGIALSGTVHWLFDRHLISLTDDYRLLVAHNRVPSELRGLFHNQMERVRLPKNPKAWPHPRYIEKHRERFAGHA
jgi:putative restriction endonuclease